MAMADSQVNTIMHRQHLGDRQPNDEEVDLHVVSLTLAREQAKRIKLEAENHVLVGKLFALRQDYDELIRKSHRKDEEINSMAENILMLKKECESLKQIALERTAISSKQKILYNHHVKALEHKLTRQREHSANQHNMSGHKATVEEDSLQNEPQRIRRVKESDKTSTLKMDLRREKSTKLEDAAGGKDILHMIERAGMAKRSSKSTCLSKGSKSFVLENFKHLAQERSARTLPSSFIEKEKMSALSSSSCSLIEPEIIHRRIRNPATSTRSSSSCSSLRGAMYMQREKLSESSSSGTSRRATCPEIGKTLTKSTHKDLNKRHSSSECSYSGGSQDATYSQPMPKEATDGIHVEPTAQPSSSESNSTNGTSQNATCSQLQDPTKVAGMESYLQPFAGKGGEVLVSENEEEENISFHVFGKMCTNETYSDDEISLKEKSVTNSQTLARLISSPSGRRTSPYGRKVRPSEQKRYNAHAA